MIMLVFPLAGVLLLAEHTLAATSRAASMREVLDATTPRPALWLVGNHGVFLMSNGLVTPVDARPHHGPARRARCGLHDPCRVVGVAEQIGRGNQIRIVLPLLDPTFGERILRRDLTGGADAGARLRDRTLCPAPALAPAGVDDGSRSEDLTIAAGTPSMAGDPHPTNTRC